MDWKDISEELQKPLSSDAIKPPAPGKFGEYVDGLHVISEANRIFGHAGWSYKITRMEQVCGDIHEIRKNNETQGQYRCGWMCTVVVSVGGASREGAAVGTGVGKPENIADVIESAVKEAETDALKRALRTFGNTFGLALYEKDKSKRQVERPLTVKERIATAKTLDDINGLISDVADLNNKNATVDLHNKATSLGFVGCKETRKYIEVSKEGENNE